MNVLVDDVDQDLLARGWRLNATGKGGAYVRIGKDHALHRLVAQRAGIAHPGLVIDHRNGDPLDNRRENLRAVPQGVNVVNSRCTRGASCYRGVSRRQSGRWAAGIKARGRWMPLGTFGTEAEAGQARSFAARLVYRPWRFRETPFGLREIPRAICEQVKRALRGSPRAEPPAFEAKIHREDKLFALTVRHHGKPCRFGTYPRRDMAEAAASGVETALRLGYQAVRAGRFRLDLGSWSCTSGEGRYRGITQAGRWWRAQVKVGGRSVKLGYFATQEEAAAAFQQARASLCPGVTYEDLRRVLGWVPRVQCRRGAGCESSCIGGPGET